MASPTDYSEDQSGPAASSDTADALPMIDIASGGPLPPLADLPSPSARRPQSAAGIMLPGGPLSETDSQHVAPQHVAPHEGDPGAMFWLDGHVLMCGCPDCSAPMTVRLWLMIADCWQCEASVELTQEQEREARRVLERCDRRAPASPAPRTAATVTASGASAGRAPARVTYVPAGASTTTSSQAAHIRHEPSAPPLSVSQPLAGRTLVRQHVSRRVSDWLHDLIKNMPAWLISLLFHVILLTILALLRSPEETGPYITLSSRISRFVQQGGDTRIIDSTDESVFDLGVPDSIDLSDPALQRAVVRADQDARQLRLVDPSNPYLPEIQRVKDAIHASSRRSLAARDPRVRVEMVRREGGTTLTEAAVARGLRWLAEHQSDDGSWSLDRFSRAAGCRCGEGGSVSSDSAGTSLALLPFLGAGQTHLSGVYQDSVARGLRWLLESQKPDGDLRGSSRQYPGMYAHGQAAIVLCEAFLMTGDEQLRIPAQKAIDFIVEAQYEDGGWRYYPREETRSPRGDTSVLGWQLMALQSALAAELSVPQATLENAARFLDAVQHRDGALYAYLPREKHSAPMTAEGLLCRIYLGWKRNHPALRDGVTWMLDHEPPAVNQPNIYYWYYATQTMHHFGGQPWEQWNLQMRDVLVATQETRGHEAGSWSPQGPLTSQGGRLYMTSLAICCLEIYYRHLPLFRQIDLQ